MREDRSARRIPSMRESFEAHYKPVEVPANNKRGFRIRYDYIGPWYEWTEPRDQVLRAKRRSVTACLCSLILYVVAAVQTEPVNYDRYVSLLGLLSLAPFVFELFGVIQFALSKEPMREESYKDITGKLKLAPPVHALLLSAAGICGAVVILRSGFALGSLWIPACYAAAGVQSMEVWMLQRRLHVRKIQSISKETPIHQRFPEE